MFIRLVRVLNRVLDQMSFKQLALVAISAGVLMCFLIFFALSQIEQNVTQENQVKPIAMRRIVVARTNIKRGEILQEKMLRTKEFAISSLPNGTSTDIREFVGLPTKVEIFVGDIITTDKIFKDSRQAGFIGMIPENCRAITIPIDNVTGVAGLVNPGNHVDLVLVTQVQGASKAEVLLQDIMLLGIDKTIDRDLGEVDARNNTISPDVENLESTVESEQSIDSTLNQVNISQTPRQTPTGVSGGTATLALNPDDVLKLAAAINVGQIHLVLRPLRPTGDTMYIKNTPAYVGADSTQSKNNRISDLTRNRFISESSSEPSSGSSFSELPYESATDYESIKQIDSDELFEEKVIPKSIDSENIPESRKSKTFEVIQWGS